MQAQPSPAASTVFVRASQLWLAPLTLGIAIFVVATPLVLLAGYPQLVVLMPVPLAMFGGLGLFMRSTIREVSIDEAGLLVRRPGDGAATPVPWAEIAEIRYVRIRQRSNQIEVRGTDGTARFLADYQVGSIHQVARAIARFYPGDTTGGSPKFAPVSGMAYLGR